MKYLHLCDDIIVIRKGEITEHGTFTELMAMKGHMAKLVTENVQLAKETKELEESVDESQAKLHKITHGHHGHHHHSSLMTPVLVPISENLTEEQQLNRYHLSKVNTMVATDENMATLIEFNQLVNGHESSLIREIQKSRLSIVSAATSIEEITPSDAEPMKLVLEDQSVYYKKSPIVSYLRAGYGIIITLCIFAFFFLVHLVRILSGMF